MSAKNAGILDTAEEQKAVSKTATLFPLAHSGDPQTSFDAGQKMMDSGKLQKQEHGIYNDIRRFVIDCNHADFTPRELAKWAWWTDYYTIQRRLSGLRAKGEIERTGEKREGCCVWRLRK